MFRHCSPAFKASHLGCAARYYAAVAYTDDHVGQLLAAVDEAGLRNSATTPCNRRDGDIIEGGSACKTLFFPRAVFNGQVL